MNITKKEMARYMDHTLLKADATLDQLNKLCVEAKEYGFYSVCVNPCNVEKAGEILEGSDTLVCTVVGFPLGQMTSEAKSYEAHEAILFGASEIDMVINVGKLKAKEYEYVREDIAAVVGACKSKKGVKCKVIIETCLLTDEEKKIACELAMAAGADFVKTSTGFSTGGATQQDVKLMKNTVGSKLEVKASGGIRTLKDALAMIEAGATRLGVSASVKIINEME